MHSLSVGLHHDVAVDQDGADDGEAEEGVGQHVDGDPAIKIKFKHNSYFL